MSAAAAAIDLGTNTALLLVGRLGPGGELELLEDRCEMPRLGEGLAREGRLDTAALARTLDVLRRFRERLDVHGVAADRVRAAGTAVLRRAADAETLLTLARDELGLAFEVLSGAEEAQLGWRAVTGAGAPPETLVVDVGGGSSEVVADGGAALSSAPVGAVVLTETFLGMAGRPPMRGGGAEALLAEVRASCAAHLPAGEASVAAPVVAIGGTAVNLACLALGLSAFAAGAVEGTRVAAGEVARWGHELLALDLGARRRLPIEPERAEILPAGLLCLSAVLAHLGFGSTTPVRISARGVRHGLLEGILRGGGTRGGAGASHLWLGRAHLWLGRECPPMGGEAG